MVFSDLCQIYSLHKSSEKKDGGEAAKRGLHDPSTQAV